MEQILMTRRHPITEAEEDLEWQFESGRLTEEEFGEELGKLGVSIPKIERLETGNLNGRN